MTHQTVAIESAPRLHVAMPPAQAVATLQALPEDARSLELNRFVQTALGGRVPSSELLTQLLKVARSAFHRNSPDLGRAILEAAWTLEASQQDVARISDQLLLGHPAVRQRFDEVSASANIVFVTGCASSGSTLLRNCMATLRDVKLMSGQPLSHAVDENIDHENVLLKRTAGCHKFFALMPHSVKIVHIVRHPLDVITSRHSRTQRYCVEFQRWADEYAAFSRLRRSHPADRMCIVRYERLLHDPDGVQQELASHLGLSFDVPFTEFHKAAHLDRRAKARRTPFARKRSRESGDRSPHHHRIREFLECCGPQVQEFCDEFGYEVEVPEGGVATAGSAEVRSNATCKQSLTEPNLAMPAASSIILHIGLPKTATTFLQHSIFRWIEDAVYVHRRYDERADAFTRLLKMLPRARGERVGTLRSKLRHSYLDAVKGAGADGTDRQCIVSDENISLTASEFWTHRGPDPKQVAERLKLAMEDVGFHHGSVKVLIGIRRQDHWFASRYAQSAATFEEFSQQDFDRRLREIANNELVGPLQWIDYADVYRTFAASFGKSNVFFMPMEALKHTPQETLADLGDFFGGIDLVDIHQRKVVEESTSRSPSLAVGHNSWRLRKRDDQIMLSEQQSQRMVDRFRESNRKVSELAGYDLKALGYC